MTSKSTQQEDQQRKYELYAQLEVEEYWLFDPKGEWLESPLMGYRLIDGVYAPITDQCSQVLGLRLEVEDRLIQFTEIHSGKRLLHPSELQEALEQAQQEVDQARQQTEKLKAQLKALGVDPEE